MSNDASSLDPRRVLVRSADGVELACYRGGAGPGLVLVHGANVDHASWAPLLPFLAAHFSATTYDRRGRGGSSDAPDAYEPEREVEDLAAVLAAAEAPFVFGHSSGAILALEAARAGAPLRGLVLYEPPFALDAYGPGLRLSLAMQIEHFVLEALPEQALTLFFEAAGQSADDIERMRAGPRWAAMVALAHTTPYDLRVSALPLPDAEALASLTVPVLLLAGGASPPPLRLPTEALAARLPDGALHVLRDDGHFAIYSSPERVAREIERFCLGARALPESTSD